MSIYGEPTNRDQIVNTDEIENPYARLTEQLSTQVDFKDAVIFLDGEITDGTLVDLMIRVRSICSDPNIKTINLIINSVGGDVYDMFGIIDYIESLDVKVNTICRGCAMSAAAIILTCGTGMRMMSRRSTVMFHQVSSFLEGKVSDIKANFDNVKNLERNVYDLLAEKTNKDASWWQENMRTDLFLSPDQLKEFGVIDEII